MDQLHPSGNGSSHTKRVGRNGSRPTLGRKEQRKALREQKKVQRRQTPAPKYRASNRPVQQQEESFNSEAEEERKPLPKKKAQNKKPSDEAPLKSILKARTKEYPAPAKTRNSPSPEPPKKTSRVVKEKLAEDDAEIAALEKKLGLKGKKKLPQSFEDDGLDEIPGDFNNELDISSMKRKRNDDDDWLERKRRKATKDLQPSLDDDESDEEDDGFTDASDDEGDVDASAVDNSEDDAEDDFEGFESEDSDTNETPRVRENPYIAPVTTDSIPSSKYIPPSMRTGRSSDVETTTRLRRQIQGLLNRLSEANLLTMLKDMESIYEKNARQHVTEILIDILIGLISDRTALTDTFMILHAGFIAAVYKVIGPHFGAQLLERLVSEFGTHYGLEKSTNAGKKEASNIIALLAEMYTFQIISSTIIFDYIRLFLTSLSDLNTELLLKIIKNCGSQLRHDDPSSLKDIVILLQKAVSEVGEETLPVRTKFMIETINNLKNNRQKTGLAASSIALEHTTRMKKTLGTLNARSGNSSEPMGIGLNDIKGSEKEGKWWLVGASWRNDSSNITKQTPADLPDLSFTSKKPKISTSTAEESTDLTTLATQQRMNTSIRRLIFTTLMSASDYKDAHTRLTRLKLKKTQDLEIPRVLLHCAGAEGTYNPYYTLIARRLCSEHRFKWAFQYGLWDLFRRMGEKDDGREDFDADDIDEGGDVGLRKIVNLGRLYGGLVGGGGLNLTILKVRLFSEMLSPILRLHPTPVYVYKLERPTQIPQRLTP